MITADRIKELRQAVKNGFVYPLQVQECLDELMRANKRMQEMNLMIDDLTEILADKNQRIDRLRNGVWDQLDIDWKNDLQKNT